MNVFQRIAAWTRTIYTTATPDSIAKRARQECDELIDAINSRNSIIRSKILLYCKKNDVRSVPDNAAPTLIKEADEKWKSDIGQEIADVIHCLSDLAAVLGIDAEREADHKLDINKSDLWSEPDEHNQRYRMRTPHDWHAVRGPYEITFLNDHETTQHRWFNEPMTKLDYQSLAASTKVRIVNPNERN